MTSIPKQDAYTANAPATSHSHAAITREQFTNSTVHRSSPVNTKTMMGTASATIGTSTDVNEGTGQCQQQTRGEAKSPTLEIECTKTFETCPSAESNSTEESTVAESSIISNSVPSQLEQKRLALRNQRFSLEQRLCEFGTHYSVNSVSYPPNPIRHVQEMIWNDPKTGMSVFYSGPLNEENEPNGSGGVLKFLDGQIYEGEVFRGMRCGHGINSWPDGQQYCGEWSQNSRHGKGRHSWVVDGGGQKVVTGEWKKGRLHGRISFSWPDGSSFDGMAVNGKRHGRGEHRWSSGKVFRGNYENGKAHGFGALTYSDGTYRGQWKFGVKEGYGTMLWNTRIYTGEWLKDKPHGEGRVVWQNGSTYTGQFARGRYDGVGVYVWPSGKKVVARWKNGVKEASEYCSWPDGRIYDGECDSEGNKHGRGKFTWSNGTSYVGAFHQNMRQGQGRLVGSGGEIIYDGWWESSQPVDCSIENILDQLVETEHGGSENDVYVDDFFVCKTNALESSENTFPQATTADSKNFGELLQVIEKPSKQKVSCGSTASDGFHPRDMGLVDMTNKLALSPEKSRSKSFQHGC